MAKTKLLTHICGGTTAEACQFLNQLCLSDYVLTLQHSGFGHTTVVMKVPNEEVAHVWRKLGHPAETCPYIEQKKG